MGSKGDSEMTTVLTESSTTQVTGLADGGLWLSADDALRATGWEIKPEGFCRDEVCVPIPAGREAEFAGDGRVNVSAFWQLLGRPAVHSRPSDVWFLGEGASDRNAALSNLQAPDFTLPDLNGNLHSLSDFNKMRILLVTWASW